MTTLKKNARYERLYEQLVTLMPKSEDMDARMATIVAVLHYKMENFFWTGFYILKGGELTVKTYQGPLACQILKKHTGVCWTGIDQHKTIIVPDVHKFNGHIACDPHSKSEIVVPLRNQDGEVIGVLDIDSEILNNFDMIDEEWLEKIVKLIW